MSAPLPRVLTDTEIDAALRELPEWRREGNRIVRTVRAGSFRQAQRIVGRICDAAEGANHHPDLHWSWTRLEIALQTHDAGGLTSRDVHLARVIDDILRDP
ncbi:MAG: 4a-hydroxytetrahydrobiopterin dehydratase [Myxococcota bacterium]|nr:4a-hydroxytetrahydrobiopterin dehydratase [Myxococcota bacterium]MDW8362051.1 4a-hydroxytetrahydrobiopterin dehydratase [Myxococcales bacterium]